MAFDISTLKKRTNLGFMTLLSSVACEWLLIFLLYVDAAFSYAITIFAHYCELKAPCPICSRLDNIFGEKRYWSLLCSNHRDEISSLVSCSVHNKLADVHDMCEECLLSIAVQKNNPNFKSYMLLVGKMWVDVEESVYQHLVVNKLIQLGFSGRRTCLCCNQIRRNKSNAEKLLLEFTPVGLGASKAHMKPPLPRVTGRSRFNRRDSLKRLRDKLTTQPTSRVHTLSHVGYTKLKVGSDSESEVPFSEDDDEDEGESDSREKYPGSDAKPLLILDQPSMIDLSDHKNEGSSKLDCVKEHGLEGLNWMDYYHEPNPSVSTELISLDDDGPQTSVVSPPYIRTISVLSELLSLYTGPSLSDTMAIPETVTNVEACCEKNVMEAEHVEADSTSEQTNTDLINCYTQSCETTELPVIMEAEPLNVSGSAKIEENLNSPPHIAVCVLPKDTEDTTINESRKDEGSNSPSHLVSAPLARSASYESLDGDRVKDIEGESIVDRLKRQIDHDRTCMDSLYKELEEERSASTIAANEAMAMITRLQEEKAALHMEALQYLRMMEEQAEYDMEALERANDLLAEKEKELQDLEMELELYRNNYIDEPEENEIRPGYFNHVKSTEIPKTNGNFTPMKSSSVSKFEDEKFYIRQCLKNLEKKLRESYFSCKIAEKPNGVNAEERVNGNPKERVIADSNGFHGEDMASNGSYVAVEESDCVHEKFDKPLTNGGEISSSAIEKDIAQLHHRLEALENDHDFLNHASYLFRNGEDGLNFIQEIAHQLHELRKMEFSNR